MQVQLSGWQTQYQEPDTRHQIQLQLPNSQKQSQNTQSPSALAVNTKGTRLLSVPQEKEWQNFWVLNPGKLPGKVSCTKSNQRTVLCWPIVTSTVSLKYLLQWWPFWISQTKQAAQLVFPVSHLFFHFSWNSGVRRAMGSVFKMSCGEKITQHYDGISKSDF